MISMVMVMILIMQDPTPLLSTTGFSQPLAHSVPQTPSRKQGTPRLEAQVKPTFIVFVVNINTLQALVTPKAKAFQSTPLRVGICGVQGMRFDLSAIMDEVK